MFTAKDLTRVSQLLTIDKRHQKQVTRNYMKLQKLAFPVNLFWCWNWTQGLKHLSHIVYCWSASPGPSSLLFIYLCTFTFIIIITVIWERLFPRCWESKSPWYCWSREGIQCGVSNPGFTHAKYVPYQLRYTPEPTFSTFCLFWGPTWCLLELASTSALRDQSW